MADQARDRGEDRDGLEDRPGLEDRDGPQDSDRRPDGDRLAYSRREALAAVSRYGLVLAGSSSVVLSAGMAHANPVVGCSNSGNAKPCGNVNQSETKLQGFGSGTGGSGF